MTLAELEVSLRLAGPDDRDRFHAVRRAAFGPRYEIAVGPWDDAVLRPIADEDFAGMPVEIIEQRGAPIGHLAIIDQPDHLFLDEIALLPDAQGRGIGTAVIQLAMQRARGAGLPLRLSVLDRNPAQRLYARLGFAVTHIAPPRIKMAWSPGG